MSDSQANAKNDFDLIKITEGTTVFSVTKETNNEWDSLTAIEFKSILKNEEETNILNNC